MAHNRRWWLLVAAFCVGCVACSGSLVCGQPPGGRGRGPAAANAPTAEAASQTTAIEPLRTASDRTISIDDIRLDLRVDLAKKLVESKATISFRCVKPTQTVTLDAVDFVVTHVAAKLSKNLINPARYTSDGKKLVVDLVAPLKAGEAGTLEVAYRVQDPKDGLHFFVPGKTRLESPLLVWSQGETSTNRYWIPCIDEPDQRQTTEIIVTVPEGFEAVSNGKLVQRQENPGNTVTFHWKQEIPHPSYLITLVVGEFDVVRHEWEGIPVLYYVPKGHRAEAEPTYGRTPEMLAYFSQRFGMRYPWAKYAQVTCFQFGGGMENTSATTMGERILCDERSLLDRSSESIVSHELAHQWWGDMVTCRDWSHTWLNEGFASYAEALWDEHARGRDDYAFNMDRKAARAIRAGKLRPVMDRRYTDPQSMFDDRSYPKGAWIVHMLRNRLGEEAFWKGIQRYGTENQFHSVETCDLRRSLERATGRDLERFFYDWVERPGNPELDVATEFLPDSQQARLTIKQTQAGEPFEFPLKIVLTCAGAKDPVVLNETMTEKEFNIRLPLPGPLERIDVDPDQAILMELKETKPQALWRAQLLESPSVPVRLRAVQHFAQSKATEDHDLLARALDQERFWGVRVELATALGTAKSAVAKQALLKGLKETDARVRRACVEGLGKLGPDAEIAATLKDILGKGDPSYAVEGAVLAAYARQNQKDAVAIITPWLSKTSHQDTLADAALAALGATEDPAVLDTLLNWTKPEKPRTRRAAAVRGLALLAKSKRLKDEQRQQIVKTLMAALESDDQFSRVAAIRALPDLGPMANSALPLLDKMAQEQSRSGLRRIIKETADKIRAQSGANASADASEVNRLRDEVKRLEHEQQELRERLDKFESRKR
jgi:aminopeptidase N